MIISLLKTLRQLIGYLAVGSLLNTNVGYLILSMLPFIKVNKYCFTVWLWFDVFICTVCHGTNGRSISGWTGQWQGSIKRYYYQALLINWIFEKLGDKPNHCQRVYFNELKKGYV
ncbi:MAG: hypothetical protein COB35_05070 [Gammaproteobacteria bacterium]|nr:MAG: hypothetical protein COB35_05070 [Gammaproteobacteria bacterium]